MAVTSFATASSVTYPTWVACNNTTVRLTKAFTSGLYRVSAIVTAENGTPSVSLVFKNSAGSVVYSDATVDGDSGSSVNAATRTVYLSADAATLDIATASNTYVSIERIGGTFETTAGLQLFVYSTSQSITIDGTFSAALIIGGGGAGGSGENPTGTGGSSGYIASSTSIAPGTYSLVVGAGGTGVAGGKGGNGGTTTFAGLTAAGGNGGAPTNGPNAAANPGGSGGGGSVYNSQQAGGVGGSNGSNGGQGGNQYGTWVGSNGSGVAKPSWLTTASTGGAGGVAVNGVSGAGGGGAGGFYGGGGGGGGSSGAAVGGAGASAAAGTGGGGGAAGCSSSQPGGAGGSGGLYLVKFA
jgi:hypothetical protein